MSPAPPTDEDPRDLRRATRATYAVFAAAGGAFAAWAGRIPAVKTELGLTPGQLGLLLLAGSAGSLVGLPLAGRVASAIGVARTVLLGAALTLAGLVALGPVIERTGSPAWTGAALFVALFGIGQWDVAMNLHGADVDRRGGTNLMPRFHAAFSLGTVASALAAAALARAGVSLTAHWVAAAAVIGALVAVAVRAFLPGPPAAPADARSPGQARAGSAWLEPRTLLVGVVVMVAAFAEGSANDWISLAFIDGHRQPEWAGILGLAVFLGCMTAGRVAGTGLLGRHGRVPLLRATFALAILGSVLVVFGGTALAYAGAAVWGVGASLGFPVGMSAAADDPARAAARVSVVSTIGYLAFLAGPPALGFLGDHHGVLRALAVVPALVAAAFLAIPATAPRAADVGPDGDAAH